VSAAQVSAYRASGLPDAAATADAADRAMELPAERTVGHLTPRAVEKVAMWCAARGI